MALLVISAVNDAAAIGNATSGIIVSPDNYIVRIPGTNVTFKGIARFGTPCFNPPYYLYNWYLNGTLIGVKDEFSGRATDYPAGKYVLTLNVTDCMGRMASQSIDIYIVDPLVAKIEKIEAGGTDLKQSECVIAACNVSACSPQGSMSAVDDYGKGKDSYNQVYIYNRSFSTAGNILTLTYDSSLIYEITDPNVAVLFPSKCSRGQPQGFFTTAIDKRTGEYYVLIGEDDFIGRLENVPAGCKNVCNAFLKDFIPILSAQLMCDAKTISAPARVGSSSNGYTEVIATSSSGKTAHFIFADEMSDFFAKAGWSFNPIRVDSGVAFLAMNQPCILLKKSTIPVEKCLLNLVGTVSGGLSPYNVKWATDDDGIIDRYIIGEDGGSYDMRSTPPLVPPLTEGIHEVFFYAEDKLGLKAEDSWEDTKIPWCCAIDSPCEKYWPGRDGPTVDTGNEQSYACDIYEVCRPELWEKAREAIACCKSNCGTGCHKECQQAANFSKNLKDKNGVYTADGLKKCAGLYLIMGFGPAAKYMTDYFWPEICCEGSSYCLSGGECCPQDLGTCSCGWHQYTPNAHTLPCQGYVSTSSQGWKSDIALHANTCMFADLPAYASMDVINTGTCADYANALTTMLRIAGYGPDEAYAVLLPQHQVVLVKFPDSPKFNIIETTGNWKTPYTPYGISGYPGFPYCSFINCKNDAGMAPCPSNVWGC